MPLLAPRPTPVPSGRLLPFAARATRLPAATSAPSSLRRPLLGEVAAMSSSTIVEGPKNFHLFMSGLGHKQDVLDALHLHGSEVHVPRIRH